MKRGTRPSEKHQKSNEFVQPPQIKGTSTVLSTKKLRKIKDFQEETRCHSVRNKFREPREEQETGRTRSVSPASRVPPVDAKFPLRKFYKLYSKIVVQLEKVKSLSNDKTNESENLIDLRRQLQRADEFSIRFSRNNLYEAKRIINSIKQLIVPYPFENLSPAHCRSLCKNIILAFQATSLALHTYINYAKNPSNLEIPDKINELVLLIADLFLCCEHVSLPPNDAYIRHDAVKICNELIQLLKSKLPVYDYFELKEAALAKNKAKKPREDDPLKQKKFSMYRTKPSLKIKAEQPKKKTGVSCLLAAKTKKSRKEERRAKITHGIYTQKLNPWEGRSSKAVKFEGEGQEKPEAPEEKKPNLRRPRFVTPREVRSQDDDVETMVQTIGDDEVSTCRISSASSKVDEDVDLNKTYFKNFLLDTIKELQHSDKEEQKMTLTRLLHSIQNSSKTPGQAPKHNKVKVYHFLSKELLEENDGEDGEENSKGEGTEEKSKERRFDKTGAGGRKTKNVFKPLKERHKGGVQGEAVLKDRIHLKLSEEAMINALKYRKAFADYRKNNIMYKKTLANKPWELVGKVSDRIVLDIIKEISMDFQNDDLLKRLYLNELLEVTS